MQSGMRLAWKTTWWRFASERTRQSPFTPPHNPAVDCLHQLNREILHLFQVYAGKPCKGCGFPGICQAAGENQYL